MVNRIVITDSVKTIQAKIIFALKNKVQKAFRSSRRSIETLVRAVALKSVAQSTTVSSLLKGKLQSDFGLTSSFASASVSSILNAISSNITVSLIDNKTADGINSIVVTLLPPKVDTFTSIPFGSYVSNGEDINWLEWLLTRGTEIVIGGYRVKNGQFDFSRSGSAIMIPGGSFSVDGEHAGTPEDNFITRAIFESRDEILNIIRVELLRKL